MSRSCAVRSVSRLGLWVRRASGRVAGRSSSSCRKKASHTAARAAARWLGGRVPSLSHPEKRLCASRAERACTPPERPHWASSSAVFTVELKGTLESTVRFVESLRLAANMTMIGDSITVVTHPASTTHKQLSDADLAAAGVTPTLLRISLGLENADDLIEDFEQAFAQIG